MSKERAQAILSGKVHINKSKTVAEIFDFISKVEDKDEKVAYLKAYNTKALQYVINGLYNVDWTGMPIPNYTPNKRDPYICNMTINTAIPRIEQAYRYRHSNKGLSEKNMQIVLEELSAPEAALIVNMIKGKKVPGISKSSFSEAYPQFFRSEDTPEQNSN